MSVQAYNRLYNLLREQILGGEHKPGEQLPAERELCSQFGVSRITARHALRLLEEQGLVERHRGRGTFVRLLQPKKLPILNSDFAGSVRKEAPNLKRRLVNSRRIVPPDMVREALGLLKGQRCFEAERLDWLDDEPLAYDRAYIPEELTHSITDEMLEAVDFLEIWLSREKLSMSYAQESIEAVAADQEAVQRLRVGLGSPMLLATDLIFGSSGQILAYFESIYRGDRIKLFSTNSKKVNDVRVNY